VPPGSILRVKILSLNKGLRLPEQSRFGTAGRKLFPCTGEQETCNEQHHMGSGEADVFSF